MNYKNSNKSTIRVMGHRIAKCKLQILNLKLLNFAFFILHFSLLIAASLLYLCLTSVEAADRAEVRGLRHWSSSGHTRVVVDLSRPVEYTRNRLSNPDRLFFDLKDSKVPKEIKTNLPVGDGILRAVRVGQYSPDTVRVVLDLETMESYDVFILDDPTRLVIDVNAKRAERITARKVVVIDPGHGGHDPGAIGPRGLREKDVTLDIALKVREILSKDSSIELTLTRETDVFIPLEERTAIARNRDADLFVSIHANASPRRAARGIETYLLNWTNDEEAIRVAARENQISLKRMREKMERYKRDVVDLIKSDLSRQYNRDESVALANYVQNSIVSTAQRIHKNILNLGVKQALFYVLVGASMPSILVEVSFISNPDEEKLLSKESYRILIADSIASGIKEYLKSQSPVQKVADRRGR
ncbi:MAG: N-acetylmuramoyl-L-alanine amidase [Thermodesulfovibrionales bacterium]